MNNQKYVTTPKRPKVPRKATATLLTYGIIKLAIMTEIIAILIQHVGWIIGIILGIMTGILTNIAMVKVQAKYLKKELEQIQEYKIKQKTYENYINEKYDKEMEEVKKCHT